MNTNPMDSQRPTTCALCGTDTAYGRGRDIYLTHTNPAGEKCAASQRYRTDAIRLHRTFTDAEKVQAWTEIIDYDEDIGLHSYYYPAGRTISMEIDVRVPGKDVRRLIAALTEIADERGL
jgi:hypothetical protein